MFNKADLNNDGVLTQAELSQWFVPLCSNTLFRCVRTSCSVVTSETPRIATSSEPRRLSCSNELCALTRAIKSNDVRAAMNLIYDKETDVDQKDPAQFDRTMLHKAAAMGRWAMHASY